MFLVVDLWEESAFLFLFSGRFNTGVPSSKISHLCVPVPLAATYTPDLHQYGEYGTAVRSAAAALFLFLCNLLDAGPPGRVLYDFFLWTFHLCCTAHKKSHFADFFHKSTTGSTSTYIFFLCDIPLLCHNSSYTFDPKCTTRRWTLRCSNYSVTKRQHFSCALRTATLSLKFENVVPEGWMGFFPCYI